MVAITAAPIDPSQAYGSIAKQGAGSVVFHYAVVKADPGNGSTTVCIDYLADAGAEKELRKIEAHVRELYKLEDMLLIRRTGCLAVGEIISLVAASSPNSEDAFEACKLGISSLKKMSTITKAERSAEVK